MISVAFVFGYLPFWAFILSKLVSEFVLTEWLSEFNLTESLSEFIVSEVPEVCSATERGMQQKEAKPVPRRGLNWCPSGCWVVQC